MLRIEKESDGHTAMFPTHVIGGAASTHREAKLYQKDHGSATVASPRQAA
jgi:hypothetical protein